MEYREPCHNSSIETMETCHKDKENVDGPYLPIECESNTSRTEV